MPAHFPTVAFLWFGMLGSSLATVAPLPIDLPDGFIAETAAQPPLVTHPIMATLGDRGKLFVGDAAGVNLNKAGLEKELPNRILLLTDTNADGVYDKSTVFADKMTFPQGGVWLDGSLYAASPPGIWKLRDADGDGVAEQREMLVGGFEFTGNAADVHGPFLHPNGRLFWCHGRKGHVVKQKDGTLVHSGLASGIWSCHPDGSDVRWHALSCADNPTEIDFTPEGEIVGTVNLYYAGPRGDTIIHWLRGGVYEREDQLDAIKGLPRTLEVMPVVHNLGHVAVAGCTFYRSGALNADWRGNLFVVHFNTQRVTRMEVLPDGATFKTAEHEFLKLRNSDAHLTDVLEDRDGSLLVIDTGGWFRIGCPSSMMAKPDVAGAIYRIRSNRSKSTPAKVEPWGASAAPVWKLARQDSSVRQLSAMLGSKDSSVAHTAGNALASLAKPEAASALMSALDHKDPAVQLAAAHALGELPAIDEKAVGALLKRLEGDVHDVDRSVEHQVMHALLRANQPAPLLAALRNGQKPALQRRTLTLLNQFPSSPLAAEDVLPLLDAKDITLAETAARIVTAHRDWISATAAHLAAWLKEGAIPPNQLALLETIAKPWLKEAPVKSLVTSLLTSSDVAQRRTAWRTLASSNVRTECDPAWIAPLLTAVENASPGDQHLVLEAIAATRSPEFIAVLRKIADDEKRPIALRMKALGVTLKSRAAVSSEVFSLLKRVLAESPATSARLEAARILTSAKVTREELLDLASLLGALGPLELREMLGLLRHTNDLETGIAFAKALKDAISLASIPESEIRSLLSNYPPAVFEVIAPALAELAAEDAERRRKLESFPMLVTARGRPAEGRKIFESGKAACTACHRIGEVGNQVGPNLSAIGAIRTERDLLESILFPSNTLARDYEAQAVETSDGQSLVGVIRKSLPEAVVLADATGREHTLPRSQIIAMQTLPASLMPNGLDRTLTEEELFDLVAFLRSRK